MRTKQISPKAKTIFNTENALLALGVVSLGSLGGSVYFSWLSKVAISALPLTSLAVASVLGSVAAMGLLYAGSELVKYYVEQENKDKETQEIDIDVETTALDTTPAPEAIIVQEQGAEPVVFSSQKPRQHLTAALSNNNILPEDAKRTRRAPERYGFSKK